MEDHFFSLLIRDKEVLFDLTQGKLGTPINFIVFLIGKDKEVLEKIQQADKFYLLTYKGKQEITKDEAINYYSSSLDTYKINSIKEWIKK